MKTSTRNLLQRFKQLNRPKKLSIIVLGLFIVYTVSGFFIIPPVARLVLEKKLPLLVHREVSVEKVRLNPLALLASIEGFSIRQKNSSEQFLGFDQLEINLQAVSLFKQAVIVKSATVIGPKINFSRIADNRYNFSDLIPKDNKTKGRAASTEPFLFSLNNIEIRGGDIHFFDQPKEKKHHVARLNLAVASISNLPYDIEHFIQPSFSAVINGTPFKLDGQSKPFAKSRETGVEIDIKNFDIVDYLKYIPNPTQAKLTSCLVDMTGTINFSSAKGSDARAQLSYAGKVIFKDTTIANTAGKDFIHFPEIAIHTVASNLLAQEFHISSVLMTAPDLQIERTKDLKILPLAFLLPTKKEGSTPAPESENNSAGKEMPVRTFRLDIDNLLLKEGHVSFTDESVDGFTTQIRPINGELKNFSTTKEKKSQFELSLTTEAHETVASSGTFQITPFSAGGSIAVTDMSFVKYMPYVKSYIEPELTSGLLSFSADFSMSKEGAMESDLLVSDIAVSIGQFIAQESDESIVVLPEFNLSGGKVILAEKSVNLGKITSKQAAITLIQDSQKRLNFSSFLKTHGEPRSAAENIVPDTVQDSTQNTGEWQLAVDSVDLSEYEVIFMDQSLAEPATLRLNGIDLKIADFSTVEAAKSTIAFSAYLNKSGRMMAQGEFGVSPLSLSLETDLNDLAFKPFQSYVDEYLYLLINSGSLSSAGKFSLERDDDGQSRIHFNGAGAIDNFGVIDTRLNEDVMSWKKLNCNDISFDSNPLKVTIGDVHLQAPFAKIIVSDSGRLNLAELSKKSNTESIKIDEFVEQQPANTRPSAVTLKEVSVTGGSLKFVDHSIAPVYSASLEEFAGKVAGLSSDPNTKADVIFSGKINQFSPVQISGLINPLAERFFADLKMDFHDIDLNSASPYTGKYLGYKTDKGKLTLNLHYLVDDKEIEAQNHMFLDQFTLGDTVQSPDAADVPIRLAIALLQNRAGEINLDIPVQGNLDDPEFSVAGVVAKVIFNLIAKAVTSPFALLGALIPDGEDLQYIQFAPGKGDIPPEHIDKLSQIASVLYERPGLRMDIIGKMAPEEDRNALQEMRLDTILKIQKIKEQQGESAKDEVKRLENITVSDEEYPHYLELAYTAMNAQQETPPKKNSLAEEKTSPAEMREELLKGITVSSDDLRLLAHTRAENVKKYLMVSGKVAAERLFLVESQISSAPDGAEEIDASDMVMQVELVIK